MAVHERVWERQEPPPSRRGFGIPEWKPKVTYGLLIAVATTYIFQLLVANLAPAWYGYLFVVSTDAFLRPWSPITSTFSHSLGGIGHLLFNAVFLYFIGPSVERLLGGKKYLILFLVSGAVSGILQAHISTAYDLWAAGGDWSASLVPVYASPHGAVGASGALMMLFGVLMILTPQATVMLLFPPIPMKMWVMGLTFAAIDVLGIFTPGSHIGHFAHLSGMAIGMLYARHFKQRLAERGMRISYG